MHNDMVDYGYLDSRPDFIIEVKQDDKGYYVAKSMGIESKSALRHVAVSELEDKLQEMLTSGELNPGGL